MNAIRTRNIYTIDDILIKAGYVFLAFSLLGVAALVRNWATIPDEKKPVSATLVAAAVIPTVIFLSMGYLFRKRERIIASILGRLELALETTVQSLVTSTGHPRAAVEHALEVINRRSLGFYVWDRNTGVIADARLNRTMVSVDSCTRCGSKIGTTFPALANEIPECPYCGNPLDVGHWNALKFKAIENIKNEKEPPPAEGGTVPRGAAAPRDFSIGIFVILLLLFWPGAIIYAVMKFNGTRRER